MKKYILNTTASLTRAPMETLDEGIARTREAFAAARRMDITLPAIEGADAHGNTVEGGVNGFMFTLRRGVPVADVPEPIIEALRNGGVEFTQESGWKSPGGPQ
jgi:hypothetical protein